MRIADFSIRRPVFAVMLISGLVVLGVISLGRLGVDLFPRVEFPVVAITTTLEGASPETVETEITEVIEAEVNTISGVKLLRSISSEGLSQVFIEFELEESVDVKAQDVREKVALLRGELPDDVDPPIIEKADPDASPIISVMVAGDLSVRDLTRFADDVVKERLQRLPGVGSVKLVGDRDREVRIWPDVHRLRSYALTVEDAIAAVQREHAELPGGRLEAAAGYSELSLKTMGEAEHVAEFEQLTVAFREGRATRLGDIADVEDGMEDERTYAELDGKRGVSLEVRRQSGRNTVTVARAIKEEVARIAETAPAGIELVVARDVSRFIESSARDVGVDMVLGGILAVLVTLAFLRSLRTTLIVSVAIPSSIVATFFLFYVMDFTLNMLTLMALSVSIGLLIDDAIVVLESIHRKIEDGEPPPEAASRGTAQVGSAVLVGSLSILSVFVPIAFMEGVVGRFFYEYGLAIAFSVSVSLLIAVTLTPSLCARLLSRSRSHGRVFRVLEAIYLGLEGRYHGMLAVALRHRLVVVGLSLVFVFVGVQAAKTIPLGFASKVDRSEFEATLELPLGAGIQKTKEVAKRVAASLAEIPEVEHVFMTVGAGSRSRVNEASFYAVTLPKQERPRSQFALMDEARDRIAVAAPEAKTYGVSEVPWFSGGGMTAWDLEYAIQGPDLAILESISNDAVREMATSGLFVDAKSSWETGKPEVQVDLDRARLGDFGVSIRRLAETLRALVGGQDVATFEDAGERYDVRLRLPENQRDDLAKLGLIQVRAETGELIDLSNLAALRVKTGPAQIDRLNRARKVTLFANLPAGVALGTATDRLDAIIEGIGLPAGYRGTHEGRAQRMKETSAAIGFAFLLAAIALYMILASQFNSFLQPIVIMLTAPLASVGAFFALAWAGVELSLFAQIGLLALMGLVMKNGILLVDYANHLVREERRSPAEAMLEAGRMRLRPVMMTTFSTVFGMIPVAFATSDGAEWRNPMGLIVIGGLLSSTFLTLFVVPVAYTWIAALHRVPGQLSAWAASALRLRQTPS